MHMSYMQIDVIRVTTTAVGDFPTIDSHQVATFTIAKPFYIALYLGKGK